MILTKAIKYKLLEYSLNTFFSKVYENILNNNPTGLKVGDKYRRITYKSNTINLIYNNCIITHYKKRKFPDELGFTASVSFFYDQYFEIGITGRMNLRSESNETSFALPEKFLKFIK